MYFKNWPLVCKYNGVAISPNDQKPKRTKSIYLH